VTRRTVTTAAGITASALAGGGFWYATHTTTTATAARTTPQPPYTTIATVTRTDLIDTDQEAGTLGFDRPRTLKSVVAGTLTTEPDPGTVVHRDEVLYGVNLVPVRLWYGTVPLSRTLSPGVTDGPDVRQLQVNLRALGYDPYHDMTLDDHFSAATAAAVDRWRSDHGRTETGQVGVGDVVFLPGAVRVGTHHAELGDNLSVGAPLTDVTSTTRIATVNLPAGSTNLAHVGDKVTVQLPGTTTTSGVISQVGTAATAPTPSQNQANPVQSAVTQATVPVTVTLDHPDVTGTLDLAPVAVNFTRGLARNVLAVPVTALVSQPDGSFAVDVLAGTTVRRVPVKTGLFSTDGSGAGQVEVTGVDEGARVVIPQ
jgi:peptidoglycan hydrolase-like protein with peptidoglycan-binding domain